MDAVHSSRGNFGSLGWCVDELDLGWEVVVHLPVPEFVEGFFFGDVPLDGGVGSGGSHGLDLSLSGVEEAVLAFGFCRPAAFDGVGVAGAFGVDGGKAVVAVELDAVDDVGLLDGDSGDLLLVALGAGGAERGGLEGRAECAPGQEDDGPGQKHQPQLLLPAQLFPRRPQCIKNPRQPQLSNAKSFQGLAAVAVNVSRNINQARCAVQQVVLISKIWVVLKDNYWRPLSTLS